MLIHLSSFFLPDFEKALSTVRALTSPRTHVLYSTRSASFSPAPTPANPMTANEGAVTQEQRAWRLGLARPAQYARRMDVALIVTQPRGSVPAKTDSAP